MTRKIKTILIVCWLFCFFATAAFALDVPTLNGSPLHDMANLLSAENAAALKNLLLEIDSRKNFQEAILIVKSLDGTDIESYAVKVFEKWRLGDADKNTGVLIVVALDDRRIRIEVGYGLEGVLTDAQAGLIIRKIITPHFRNNNYFEGLRAATSAIQNLIEGDASTLENIAAVDNDENEIPIPVIIFAILLIIFVLVKVRKASSTGRFGSNFGGFSSGSFGGGGFSSGGGFTGGGGFSGGGGASGGW